MLGRDNLLVMTTRSGAIRLILALAVIGLLASGETTAGAQQNGAAVGDSSGLPVPRFVSLGSDRINVRRGPGTRYPIAWIFVREGLPVEVIAEFEHWRQIRDSEGAVGWVHKNLLSGERTVVVRDGLQALHREPYPASPAVARLQPGVIARVDQCRDAWCAVEIGNFDGWVMREYLWGVYPEETVE